MKKLPLALEDPEFYSVKIRDLPEGERPREKLISNGPGALSDAELIAILLRSGTRKHTAIDLAQGLLARLADLNQLSGLDYAELARLKGIGPAKAASLVAAFELGRRVAGANRPSRLKIDGPEAVFRHFAPKLGHLRKEVFLILALNSANILLRDIRVSEGILNASLVHPREVFKAAILESAASVILLHNHPSGETQPSGDDRQITQRLAEAGKLLNIPVLDHIIISASGFYSFREAGALQE